MIARYSALGLTNEQMAANPVWVDKTGNGHDLQMKNFFWGGMSGVGGYNQNFNQYFVGVDESNKTVSDSSMKLVLLESDSQKVIYDRNWVEYKYTADQNFSIVKSSLNIGFNLNNYTQIAFKNLGIYNNQLLSKDDCIKAYNYLQTLKAK